MPEVQTRVIVHESIQTDPIKKTPPPVEKVLRNNYSIQSQTEPIEIMQPKIPIPIEAPVMRSPVVVQQFVQTEPEVIKSHVVVQESVQTDVEISEDESEEENVNSEIIYWMRSEILKRMNAKNFVKLDQCKEAIVKFKICSIVDK